ncbi:MAG: glycosyltransferase family 4 protein, partial [Anaerolineae bacterium]
MLQSPDAPLRICMITDCYPPSVGGIENHVYALSRELAHLGHHVSVVTHREVHSRRGAAAPVVIPPGVEVVRLRGLTLRLPDGSDPALDPSMIAQLGRLLTERDYDIVHGHTVESPFVLALMRKAARMGFPTIITKHSMIERPKRPPIVGAIMRALMVAVVNQFTAYIAVSEPAAEELRPSRARAFVIHNAIDMDLFRPDASLRASMRASLGFGEGDIVVGFLSRFVPSKGIVELVRVGQRLAEQDARLRFLLVGGGPLKKRVEGEVLRNGLADRFRFVGFQPWTQTPAYLNAMDIFAFPSQSEGFGMALLEAMACGLPSVTTDRSGTQDIVRPGETALVADSLDDLESSLVLLIRDQALRQRLGVAARRAVEQSMDWNAVARRTAEAYRETIALKRGKGT